VATAVALRDLCERRGARTRETRYDAAVGIIRYGRPGDAEEIAELGRRAYTASFGELWTPAGLATFLAEQLPVERIRGELEGGDATRYVVAERAGELLGFAKLLRDRPVTALEGERGLWLQQLYMHPKATGKGIGSVLLHAVGGIAEETGEERIWLDVLRSNTGAIRLYERHGFVHRIPIPWASDLRDIGMWVMTRLVR
jgi:diamine N-acetyltransferase